MSVKERNKHLRIVAEIMELHLPDVLNDQQLARDLLSVISVAIQSAWEDAEKSARAWDKKAYHVKADRLRDEWSWAMGAANYAEGLAYRDAPIDAESLRKLRMLIEPELSATNRTIVKNPEAFRGAAAANRARQEREGSRTPKRSMV
jgi:hypothetical protein